MWLPGRMAEIRLGRKLQLKFGSGVATGLRKWRSLGMPFKLLDVLVLLAWLAITVLPALVASFVGGNPTMATTLRAWRSHDGLRSMASGMRQAAKPA